MTFTIIGVWEGGEPWVEYAEGQDADQAVKNALRRAQAVDGWDEHVFSKLDIVEVIKGRIAPQRFRMTGELTNALDIWRKGPKEWRPEER